MVENNEKGLRRFAGENLIKLLDRRPVGFELNKKDYHLWENIRVHAKSAKIPISPDLSTHMIEIYGKIADIYYPTAINIGLNPIDYINERITKLLEIAKEAERKKAIEKVKNIQKIVAKESDSSVLHKVKSLVTRSH